MKLDRNTNSDGRGKYALINQRKLAALPYCSSDERDAALAIGVLTRLNLITWGSETPGDQFFVMKYKDRFTADGLAAYAAAVDTFAAIHHCDGLHEFATEIREEAAKASRLGIKIPD